MAVLRNNSKVYPYVGIIQIRLPVGGSTSLSACHTSSRLFKAIIHPFVEKSSASGNISIAVAVAIALFGTTSPAALATTVGVLTEVPVMLFLVSIANKTKKYF